MRLLLGGEVANCSGGIGAGEGVEFGFLVGSETFDSGELGALELALLIRFAGSAIAFEVVATVDVVGARLGLGLFDELGLGDGRWIVFDEGDFFAFEKAGFGCLNAFDAADGEFAGPEAVLREGDGFGGDGLGLRSCAGLARFLRFGESLVHAGLNLFLSEELVFPRKDVFSLAINEANHGIVPRGFVVFLQQFGFGARFVVAHEKGDEIIFD